MQKIWLGVFLAMFIVPEILWSPVGNFVYELEQDTNHVTALRINFLTKSENIDLWSWVLLLQFFGLLFTAIYLIVLKKKFKNQVVLWVIAVSIFVLSLYVLNLYRLSSMRFTL